MGLNEHEVKMKHRFRILCLVLIMLCSLLWAEDLREVRLQLKWKHQFQFAGYYAAIEKGFYKDMGLDVQLLEAKAHETPFDAVFNAKAEFGTCTTDILVARSQGMNPVVLANIYQHSPHIVIARQNSGIRHVHDLVGKKIAAEPGAADLYAFLLAEGLSLSGLNVEELDFSMDKFLSGDVDAITAYSTDQLFPLEEAGYQLNIMYPSSSGIDFYGDLLFTSADLIKKDPILVQNFTNASLKGWKYALANQEEIVQLIYTKYSQRHSLDHLRFEAVETEKLILPKVVEIGYSNPGRWNSILNSYKKLNRVDEDMTLDGMLYSDYQKQAIKIPWKVIIVLSLALLIATAFWLFYYHSSKLLKKEIHKRELLEAEKDKFFSIIAHDLRSPFNAFLGLTQLLLENMDSISQSEIKKYAEDLNKSAKNLYRLLGNLLEWSRIKQGLTIPKTSVYSLHRLIADTIKSINYSAQLKNLSLITDLREDYNVQTDMHMFETILRNLLSNAIKFTPRNGRIIISSQDIPDGFVEISVQDSGIGMSDEILANLFRIDIDNKRPGTEEESSTGLGLILCKEFVELCGGSIRVQSEVGKGSLFTFSVPLAKPKS